MTGLIPIHALPESIAPFTDANFKLAVLDALMAAGQLDLGSYPEFLQFIEGPQYDYEKNGYQASAAAYAYLTRYPLTVRQLGSVARLILDGGLNIYPYIYPFWGGETEEFDIHDLADIALLPGLKYLDFTAMLTTTDLSPLAGHPALEDVGLGMNGTWRHFDVLESLPALRLVSVYGFDLDDAAAVSVRRLKQRGVEVRVRSG